MQNINIESNDHTEHRAHLELVDGAPALQAELGPAPSELRTARIASVITAIHEGFSDREFSTRVLARRLGLSVRYVQALMQDSGISITERILELRLLKAHGLLMSDRSCTLKISDIAASSGFNEVSYFHRCFRRRFGAAPARFRAQAEAAE